MKDGGCLFCGAVSSVMTPMVSLNTFLISAAEKAALSPFGRSLLSASLKIALYAAGRDSNK